MSVNKIINKILNTQPKILVVGDIMVDKYLFGKVHRISPEAPVPIVECYEEKKMLGGCGNVIRNLANLGVKTSVISAIGKDLSGNFIIEQLLKKNISVANIVQVKNLKTTEKMRIISDNQQMVRVDWDQDKSLIEEKYLLMSKKTQELNEIDGIIISDYGKGVCTNNLLKSLIKIAKSKEIPVFVDPKGKDWAKYKEATVITPNQKEAENILNTKLISDEDFLYAGDKICTLFNIESCIITRSSQGMSFINKDYKFHLKSNAKEIYDVSGAGDTVIAAIAAGVVVDNNPKNIVNFANQAAGIVVGHIGTSAVTIEELKKQI